MWTGLVVLAVLSALVCLSRVWGTTRIRTTRADRTAAAWMQVATYADGRITHVTPVRDGVHIEDETGDCPCHPQARSYELADGRAGTFYTHRTSAATAQPAPLRVPRRFRPGWRWPE